MVFSNLFFLYCFLPLCIIFYSFPKKTAYKNAVLIIFSLIFYAWGEPVYILLLLFSSAVNYIFGYILSKAESSVTSKITLGLSLALNIGILAVFKYSGFIVENINNITGAAICVPDIRLPIGISFYTFQAMSYTIDCYWKTIKPQKNYFYFLMYLSLFPQLVAGPIVRYSTIENEITNRQTTKYDLAEGFTRLSAGLGKKVILADNLSVIADAFLTGSLSELSVLGTWYGVIIYSLQIYFDFSGYSDMAIGLGRIFGFHFDENFRYPFMCRDITEFWQRWHISLGSFFRDYLLYVPIFGKRRKYGGLFLVWFSTGLWHGAAWNYIIWGLYYGLFILIESLIGRKRLSKIPLAIRHIYNKIVIIIGFGIFYFEDTDKLLLLFRNLFGISGNGIYDTQLEISVVNNLFLIIISIICCFPIAPQLRKLSEKNTALSVSYSLCGTCGCVFLIIISSILLVNSTNHPFLYFRF